MKKLGQKTAFKIFITCLLIIVVVTVFAGHSYDNRRRIARLNAAYIKNATITTAHWVDDILDNARSSIKDAADLYGKTLTDAGIRSEDLQAMADNALFDYVEFIDVDGNDINPQGIEADVSERSYFIKGMQGESGMDGTYISKTTGERLVIFYAPVIYRGEIIGVLTGHYQEARMRQILSDRLFDEQVPSLLCLEDGTVVSCVGMGAEGDNLLDYMRDRMSPEELQGLKTALAEEKEYAFTCRTDEGTTMGYVCSLSGNRWTLVQLFPAGALKSMQREANLSGVLLELEVAGLFVTYLLYLLMQEWRRQRRLKGEKEQAEMVIEGINQLFSRFVVVNLEQDTYVHLNGVEEEFASLPERGRYSEYITFFKDKIPDRDGFVLEHVLDPHTIMQRLNEQTPFEQYEYQICVGDEIRWQNTSIIVLERKEGKPNLILLATQEITGLKEKELQTQEALQESYMAEQAANHAKSDFLSRMSHDIRTPMNAIMGMTAIARMHMDDKDRVESCLDKIGVSGKHLLRLINEVLDMSKIESGKLELMNEEFDLSDMVNDLLGILHPQMESKEQQFSATMSGVTHEKVVGDAQRLSQVLLNIMGNAVKYTPNGGFISLHINETPSGLEGTACYEFIVTDTGIGMDPKFAERIFEPFSRAADSRTTQTEGTGLGMSIAKSIVSMMNGDIEVDSKKGEGTRVKVIVFLEYQTDWQEEAAELAGKHVMVVDDEREVCENACGILESIGMNADYYTDGDEAVEALVKDYGEGKKYAAVILDWRMPKKDGVTVTREIRERIGREMPVIILSAYDWSAIEHEAKEAGANEFIAKPLFKSRLIFIMKKALLGHLDESRERKLIRKETQFVGKRILMVEDNEINMEISVEILSMAGFMVDQAKDGREAVEILTEAAPGTYQLVLMDIHMPIMDGYEATEILRKSEREDLQKLPILAMTADAFAEDIRKAKDAGMNGHIAKPIEIGKLIEVLKEWF